MKGNAAWSKGVIGVVLTCLLWMGSASAGSIIGVTLMDAADGDVLRIEADKMGMLEHFDLDNPDRLLLKIKNTGVKPDVQDIHAGGEGVQDVKLGMDGKDAVIEVSLSGRIPYRIEQKLDAVLVRFTAIGAKSDSGAMVSSIQVVDRDDMTELVLNGQHMDASHNVFMTADKKQLILDLWGGHSALAKEFYEYAAQRIRHVVIGQAEDRLRIIVALVPGMAMQQQVEARNDQMVVRLGRVMHTDLAVPKVVEGVDFEPADDEARVVIRSSSVNPVVSVHEENDNVIVDLQHMKLAKGLERSLDVSQFPGPVAQLDSYQLNDQVRVVARLRHKARFTTFQQGNVFTLRLAPLSGSRNIASGDGGGAPMKYAGQKVTFNMKDMDLRNALTLIAEMANLNIIMASDVNGTITMRLIDVPWDQALDLILTTKGLGKEQMGNVLRIAPLEALQAEYQTKLAARQGSEQLEPLVTEFITLNFAKASDVERMLKTASKGTGTGADKKTQAATDTGGDTLLSSRGSVLVDKRTNTLIVKDTRAVINNIKRLLAKIDQPVRQVLIESRIVEASNNFQRDLGIRWGGYVNQTTGFNFPGVVAIGAPGTTQGNAAAFVGGGGAAGMTAGNLVDLAAGTGPGNGGAIGLTLGSFNGAVNLNLELSAAEADNKIKIVSSPRVITSNMKAATITQGVQVPITTPGTANSPATTTLQSAALTLNVTPQVTSNDGIIMDVSVTNDSPVVFNGSTGINTKQVNTSVYMHSGETVVIGGIYTQNKVNNKAKVPFLAELPVIGLLFKKKAVTDNRNELLIFLTPKVLKPGAAPGTL